MTRINRISVRVWLVIALSLVAPRMAFAVGQEVGRITGRVTEAQTNAPVPGASIVVTGAPLIGPPRQTTTDEDGVYEVPNLDPGDYDLEVTFSGVKPIHRRVRVEPSVATPLDIPWSVELAETPTTAVVVERHPTNPDSPMTGSVFSVRKFENLPLARTYQSVLGQAPGVIGTGNANVRGATTRQNKFMIDGLDITDVNTNTFRGNWQFEAADTIQTITGGFEAKYNAIGAITNIITRSGSDELHFDANFYIRPNFLQSFSTAGRQVFDYERPFADEAKPPLGDYEVGFIVDGPILKHQLWYSASFRYSRTTTVQPAAPPLNTQAPNRLFQLYQPRLKLTWAPSARHKFSAMFIADPTKIDFANNNGGQANTTEPLAAFTQNQGGWHVMSEWDYFISQNIDSKILLGFQKSGIDAGAQGKVNELDPKYGVYDFDRPRHVNNVDGSAWGNQATYSTDSRPKFQLDASLTYRTRFLGLHEAEAGFQGSYSHPTVSVTPTGNGVSYIDNNGGPLKDGLCDDDPFVRATRPDPNTVTGNGCSSRTTITGYSTATYNYNMGVYIQDRWKPTRWLTIVPGIRWDRYDERMKTDPSNPNPFYGYRALLYGFGPRLAVITDLTGDQKTIFQVSYGRATQPIYAATVNSVYIANNQRQVTETWSSTGRAFGNPVEAGGPGTAYLDTTHHTPAHGDEILLRLSREVFTNSVVELDYDYKRVSNILELQEINRIWDPSGNRVIDFEDPNLRKAVSYSTYPDGSYTKYSGVSLAFESRPTPNLDFQGSYTLSYTWGPTFDDNQPSNQYANPRQQQFYYGYALDTDVRHFIKTNTTYTYAGITVGLLFNWNSGQPNRKAYNPIAGQNLPTRYRAPFGLDPGSPLNDVRSWSAFRDTDLFTLGLTLSYDLYAAVRQHVVLTGSITNLLDLSNETVFNRTDNDSFGTPSARQGPRRITLGIRYRY